jgi:hypothetical protein
VPPIPQAYGPPNAAATPRAYDPYRYGPPPGQPPRGGWRGVATGRQILVASWNLLKQNRSMTMLPLVSFAASLLGGAVLFAPGWVLGRAFGHTDQAGAWVGGVLLAFGATVVGVYFQAALVIGANMQADGMTPTAGQVLRAAWTIKGDIVAWGVVSTTVGIAIRAIEQRFGTIGRILGIVSGVAWAVATYLVVPVVVSERLGPVEAVRRSGGLIKQIWGTGVRTTLRWGAIQLVAFLVPVFMIICGIVTASSGGGMTAAGVLIIAAGVITFIGLAAVFSAISTYAQTMIYRYAVGQPIPISTDLMAGAFRPRRGSRTW